MSAIKTKFSVQSHWQKKNKRSHFDLRILAPSGMKLWSWALPKSKFPDGNDRLLAIKTADHHVNYMYFHGSLNSGDVVDLFDYGTCHILRISSTMYIFKLIGKKIHGVFVFIKSGTSKDTWLVVRKKNNESETKT